MSNECPICSYRGAFRNFRGRLLAQCPQCSSLERHRLAWLFWQQETNLFDGAPKKMLHMAPEPCFRGRLPNVPGLEYLTGDLSPTSARAMLKLNLCQLDLAPQSFDLFHCSHVLEHIPNDAAAMRELHRVLKPGGWGLIQVPLRRGAHTLFDPQARTPQQRKRLYGQANHVRIYGELDLGPALTAAGFQVQPVPYAEQLHADLIAKYNVARDELLYFCQRPRT